MPEPDVPAEHRRPAELHFPRFQDDRFVQREMLMLVILAKKDAKQNRVARKLHGSYPAHGVQAERERVTRPDGQEAGYDRYDDVASRIQPLTIIHQVERLQAERREGRVTTAQSDHDELPHSRSGKDASIRAGQGGKEADDERARDVDEDRAPRKA